MRVLAEFSDEQCRRMEREVEAEAERWRLRSVVQSESVRNRFKTFADRPERLCVP